MIADVVITIPTGVINAVAWFVIGVASTVVTLVSIDLVNRKRANEGRYGEWPADHA